MKKILSILSLILITVVASVTLASCGGGSKSSQNSGDDPSPSTNSTITTPGKVDLSKQFAPKKILTVWMDDSTGSYFAALKKDFSEFNPNVLLRTQSIGNTDSIQQMTIKGPSGNGADIFVFPHDNMSKVVLQGLARKIDDQKLISDMKKNIAEVPLKVAHFTYPKKNIDGIYGVPQSIEAIGLYYNTKLVKDSDVPTTMAQLLKQAAKWNPANENTEYLSIDPANAYMMQPFLTSAGINVLGENQTDPSQPGFEQAGFSTLVDNLRKLQQPLLVNSAATQPANFVDGKVPFRIDGPWALTNWIDKGIKFKRVQFPTFNGQKMRPFVGAQMAAIYSGISSDKLTAAYSFLDFLTTKNAGQDLLDTLGKAPALKSDIVSSILEKSTADEQLKQSISIMIEDVATGVPMPTIPAVAAYWDPMAKALEAVFKTNKTAKEISTAAMANYQATLKQYESSAN